MLYCKESSKKTSYHTAGIRRLLWLPSTLSLVNNHLRLLRHLEIPRQLEELLRAKKPLTISDRAYAEKYLQTLFFFTLGHFVQFTSSYTKHG